MCVLRVVIRWARRKEPRAGLELHQETAADRAAGDRLANQVGRAFRQAGVGVQEEQDVRVGGAGTAVQLRSAARGGDHHVRSQGAGDIHRRIAGATVGDADFITGSQGRG